MNDFYILANHIDVHNSRLKFIADNMNWIWYNATNRVKQSIKPCKCSHQGKIQGIILIIYFTIKRATYTLSFLRLRFFNAFERGIFAQ